MNLDPEDYYAVAKKLVDASNQLEADVRALDRKLDVARSAGSYKTGGPQWAQSYDQSASDVFEIACLSAIAARQLGYLIHQAGLNHAEGENASNPNGPLEPTPAPPQGTTLETSLHPSQHAVGGNHERPWGWSLIVDRVKKEWADCDEDRISSTGASFADFGEARGKEANTLWTDVTSVFTGAAQKDNLEIDGMVDEVANVCAAISGTELAAKDALATACKGVGELAKTDKDSARTMLKLVNLSVASLKVDSIAAHRIPVVGGRISQMIDEMIESITQQCAELMDNTMQAINDKVSEAANSNTGIYATVSADTMRLSSILDRTPRQTDPVRNRTVDENKEAGDEAERRAGVPPGPKRTVTVTDHQGTRSVIPDRIDDQNLQVTEVKDTNEVRPYRQQILDEATWAQQNGYTMTLVVDHRTQINDPQIQAMINSGQIELVRMELDDNDDH